MKKELLLRLSHGPEQHVLTISTLMCQRPTTATPYQIFCFKCDLCDFYLTSFGPQTEEEDSTRKTLLQVSAVLIATSFLLKADFQNSQSNKNLHTFVVMFCCSNYK